MPDNLIFSERTNWELSLNELVVAYQQLKESNVSVLDLIASNPTECGFSYPPQTLDCLSTKENLNYDPSPRGLLVSFKESISSDKSLTLWSNFKLTTCSLLKLS